MLYIQCIYILTLYFISLFIGLFTYIYILLLFSRYMQMHAWFDLKLYLIPNLFYMVTLASVVNDCNFLKFIWTLIVFIVNTPESIWAMWCINKFYFDLFWWMFAGPMPWSYRLWRNCGASGHLKAWTTWSGRMSACEVVCSEPTPLIGQHGPTTLPSKRNHSVEHI